MKKGTVLAFCLLFVPAVGLLAQKRGMSNPNAVFVEKGTRSIGISAGWNSWDAQGEDGVDLLGIISGVKGSVNLFDITAGGAWFVKDNLSVGLRVGFSDARADIDSTRFLGNDERLFWQRAEDRNRDTAKRYDELGLACYEAMEAFVEYHF